MKTKAIELYNELRKIDVSSFWINGLEEKKIPKSIVHHSRFIGSEFDRSLKHIIAKNNQNKGPNSIDLTFQVDQNTDEKIRFRFYSFKHSNQESFEKFSLKKYIETYDFQSEFSYGIKNEFEISQCQQYLKDLHNSINLNELTSNKFCLNFIRISGFHTVLGKPFGNSESNYISGFPDLIMDNRLLDIKADIKINGRKPKYVAQILFYYFLIQVFRESINEHSQDYDLLDINKIGFYYAAYDKLIEVEVEKLLPNKDIIVQLFKNELIYGNLYVRELIEKSLMNKALTDEELNAFESSIIEKKTYLYQTWDKRNVQRYENELKYFEHALNYYKIRLTPSKYKEYKKQIKIRIKETESALREASIFVTEITDDFDKNKFIAYLEDSLSDEFRGLILKRRFIIDSIENFDYRSKFSLNLNQLKKELKLINKEIQSRSNY